jgi:hypothetical protein
VDDRTLSEISKKLAGYGLPRTRLIVHQTVIRELDEASLKKSLLSDVLSSNQETFDAKDKQIRNRDKQIQDLKNEISALQAERGRQEALRREQQKIFEELVAQYPRIKRLAIARTSENQSSGGLGKPVLLVDITSAKAFSTEDRRRIVAWLKVRAGVDDVKLVISR